MESDKESVRVDVVPANPGFSVLDVSRDDGIKAEPIVAWRIETSPTGASSAIPVCAYFRGEACFIEWPDGGVKASSGHFYKDRAELWEWCRDHCDYAAYLETMDRLRADEIAKQTEN